MSPLVHVDSRGGWTVLLMSSHLFSEGFKRRPNLIFALGALLSLNLVQHAQATVALWDTRTPLGEKITAHRDEWKVVPVDLFALEVDPKKSSSDPGYYGREYLFKGDAVVENDSMAAVLWSSKGKLVLFSKGGSGTGLGEKVAEIAPLQMKGATISHFAVVRNAADQVMLEATFSKAGQERDALFTFGKDEIIEVKPGEKLNGISLAGEIEHGIVPGFIGDDLIFGPVESEKEAVYLPSENLFLALLKGQNHELVMTWPKGKQQMILRLGTDQDGKRPIESIDFENDGQSIYIAALSAPDIWHKEQLSPSYLEKEMQSQWKRPFPAKWQTQLNESGVTTTYAFRGSKGTVWRGVPGSYDYPVWFDGDSAFYHLGKKVPPRGESLVYFLEGQDTPLSVTTP